MARGPEAESSRCTGNGPPGRLWSAHTDLSLATHPHTFSPLDPLTPLKQTARRRHTHRPKLAGLLAPPTSKPSPCPTLPPFDRLPLDSPTCISPVRSYSFRTLVFFPSLLPLYPTVLYATHSTSPETAAVLQHAHVGQRSRTHGPRLPHDQHCPYLLPNCLPRTLSYTLIVTDSRVRCSTCI